MAIQINGTSGISGVDGSATTPALQGTDTNTGISFGTDEVNVVTGGSTRTTVDSSGRLLVGTTSAPTSGTQSHYGKLIVSGSSAGNTHAYAAFITGSTAETQGPEVSRLVFGNTNAEYGRIDVALDGTAGTSSAPGRMVFYTTASGATSPTERLRITSDGTLQLRNSPGIDFSQIQTNVAGMTSETLDSYEEGTFTPTIVGTTTAGTANYSGQIGRYTKIGRNVTIYIYLNWGSGTGTGSLQIWSLPFTTGSSYAAASITDSTISTSAGNILRGRTDPGQARITLKQEPTGGGSQSNCPYDSAAALILTCTYHV